MAVCDTLAQYSLVVRLLGDQNQLSTSSRLEYRREGEQLGAIKSQYFAIRLAR